jgi:phosphoribosylanthranilate isomerase
MQAPNNMYTRIKICGITRPGDGLAAAQLGADAIGLVFHKPSARYVEVPRALEIIAALPPFVTVVGLFVDADAAVINSVVEKVPLDMIQYHGNEPAEACDEVNRPYIKALRVRADMDVATEAAAYPRARAVLLDTYSPHAAGGTGEAFDWSKVPRGLNTPIILAGGLTPANVAEAIRAVHPHAVDVSSGVESSKGIKDAALMSEFIEAVKREQ